MNGSVLNLLTAAGIGTLALSITTATSLAGEPIIMGTQRGAPDPGQRPGLDERLDPGAKLGAGENPLRNGAGAPVYFVPPPVVVPSKRSQNERDERANWMMLNRGDLTDRDSSDGLFGSGSALTDSPAGRRDYFFRKTEGQAGLNARQPLTDKTLDLVNRPDFGLSSFATESSRQDESAKARRAEASRDNPDTTTDGRRTIDEPGLGPLMNPGRISGSEGIERWSSSINQAAQRRKINGMTEAQSRREQYLEYLGNAQYSGANYPVNSAWEKYQREFTGPTPAASSGDSRLGTLAPLAARPVNPTVSKPLPGSPGAILPGGLNSPGSYSGNLPGAGSLPSSLQKGRALDARPKVDYSVPKDPASSFDFK